VRVDQTEEVRTAKRGALTFPPVLRIVVLVGLIVLVIAVVWVLQGGFRLGGSNTRDLPRVGGVAPDFTLQNDDGQAVSLASYRGQAVVLNFWATWCIPCRSEMPAINAVALANPGKVAVVAVDVLEGKVLVDRYRQEVSLSFVPLLDPTGDVTGRYHVSSIPTSFFLGPDGTIRAINVGPMDRPLIEQNLRKAL
jgi:thiol-disulfide isomerase/thioredoxin